MVLLARSPPTVPGRDESCPVFGSEDKDMALFHQDRKIADSREHASASEIVGCFSDERGLLSRLALLITGDQATADHCVVNACDMTMQGHSPFRDWLSEWAKSATITSAISQCVGAIRACEATYQNRRCSHNEHLSLSDAERERILSVVLETNPGIVIADLDPLSRAVLVLRLAIRSSIQDCVVRLNVRRTAVVAANCQVMTWLHDLQLKRQSADQRATPDKTYSGVHSPSIAGSDSAKASGTGHGGQEEP